MSVRAAVTRASSALLRTLGTMIAARIPMMTTTTMSSMRVKPRTAAARRCGWRPRRAKGLKECVLTIMSTCSM